MARFILIAAGVMESVWAVSLEKSHGFSQLMPTAIFIVALILSMVGLSLSLRTLPLGTAYAVWVGIGAALTALYSMFVGAEPVSLVRLLLIAGLITCVIGLKVLGGDAKPI